VVMPNTQPADADQAPDALNSDSDDSFVSIPRQLPGSSPATSTHGTADSPDDHPEVAKTAAGMTAGKRAAKPITSDPSC
jgi:hypothetical protein